MANYMTNKSAQFLLHSVLLPRQFKDTKNENKQNTNSTPTKSTTK